MLVRLNAHTSPLESKCECYFYNIWPVLWSRKWYIWPRIWNMFAIWSWCRPLNALFNSMSHGVDRGMPFSTVCCMPRSVQPFQKHCCSKLSRVHLSKGCTVCWTLQQLKVENFCWIKLLLNLDWVSDQILINAQTESQIENRLTLRLNPRLSVDYICDHM